MLRSLISRNSQDRVGERYTTIIKFLLPEYVTSLVIYSMPFWIDSYFIGQLESTVAYAALGSTNNLLHLLIKIAEAFSVGTVIIAGGQNGRNDYRNAGRTIRDSFWITFVLGLLFSGFLFFCCSVYLSLVWGTLCNCTTWCAFFALTCYRCIFYFYFTCIYRFFTWCKKYASTNENIYFWGIDICFF